MKSYVHADRLLVWDVREGWEVYVRVYLVCQVKSHVPADRLLVWDVREGWGPLCKFLEVPVPNKPFPR